MRHSCILVVVALVLFSNCGNIFSQISNSNPWPTNPPVGIGTQLSTPAGALSALHIHFNSIDGHSDTAMLRLSEGTGTNSTDFGLLGLMPYHDTTYSSLSSGNDLILHQHQDGDIIITNFSRPNFSHAYGTSIRFATTGDTTIHSIPSPGHHDLERVTIMGNGNVGINLPPSSTGLDSAKEQLQIGGGTLPLDGQTTGIPGLTLYGGNRFEGMPMIGGDFSPYDPRYLGFNYAINHMDSSAARVFRLAPMSNSLLGFDPANGGMITLESDPYDPTHGITYFKRGLHLLFMGSKGLEFYKDVSDSDQNHHLFDCWVPGFQGYGSDSLTNANGLFIHYTPVYIGEKSNYGLPNFTNLPNVHPDMGDNSTWLLAVDGPALFKEAYVDDTDWPDYVFDPGYKLTPLDEVEKFFQTNHHLPDLPAASKMAETGVPLGKTEEAITKQLEETLLYVTQLSHKIEALESEVQDLKNEKGK